MSGPVLAEINLDGDKTTLSFNGKSCDVYACDFVDGVYERIEAADAETKLPEYTDEETGETKPGTHGRGAPFVAIIRDELQKAGLEVKPNRALVIWESLVNRVKEYRESFKSGRSSESSSASPHPVSSADAQVSELLSKPGESSGQPTA